MLMFRDGDEQAFRTLYIRYRKKIINYCYRFFPDRTIAEELAQEVFVRMYRAGSKYRPDARFSTWLFKIATNVCLNELRKKQYHSKTDSLDQPIETDKGPIYRELESDPESHPGMVLESEERDQVLRNALAALPPKQKAALILRIYEEFSYQEIAQQLKCSESSVKSLIHRGRESLKEVLGSYIKE